jgi:hypothetical protein
MSPSIALQFEFDPRLRMAPCMSPSIALQFVLTQPLWEVFREVSEVWLLDNCGDISGWRLMM